MAAELSLPVVKVNRKAADRVLSGHPWIFQSDVLDRSEAVGGDVVLVQDQAHRTLGTAHYSEASQITLRLFATQRIEVDRAFYYGRLERALTLRQGSAVQNTNAYRLVFSEGDLLPGLTVDRYGEYLVMQTLTQGMEKAKPVLLDCLQELLQPQGVVERNDVAVRSKENLPLQKGVIAGEVPGAVEVCVNGLTLHADLMGGQKTGIYLDQRENYQAAAQHAHGRALDCFTSTGGFALHLARRCESVEAVDSSAGAIAAAQANAAANSIGNISFREADVFELLTHYAASRRIFHTIVLDPPAFTKSRGGRDGALRGYKEINQRALRMLGPGGILVTCSCSHHVSEAELLQVMAEAALDTHKTLRVRERRTQAQDHPILLTVPETHYLKCLIFEVV